MGNGEREEPFTPTTVIVETDHLTREVEGTRIVDDVTVEVRRGEVLGIVGSSSAGKSSFLRLLNRLEEPTGGTVRLKGIDYRQVQLRGRVGMVTQTAYLFPGTIADNLRFGPLQQGIFSSSGLTALICSLWIPSSAFSSAEQLTLRPLPVPPRAVGRSA